MTESRLKMARLPAGADPIVNPIGGAPAVLYERDGTTIVSLPGVPGELEAIVERSLDELFAQIFGSAHYEERSLVVELQDESAIAEILRQAEIDFPKVYVKSRAKVLGSTRVIHVTLSRAGTTRPRSRLCSRRRRSGCWRRSPPPDSACAAPIKGRAADLRGALRPASRPLMPLGPTKPPRGGFRRGAFRARLSPGGPR